MTFRWRLALTYAALVGLALFLGSIINLLALHHMLYAELDATLRRAAERYVMQEAAIGKEPPMGAQAILDAFNRQQPIRTTEFDAQGREVDWGPSRVGFRAQAGAWQVGRERVYMLRTAHGWVQTSQNDMAVQATLRRMWRFSLLSVPLVLVLALVIGSLLVRRALDPVTQVTALARRIARSGKTGERVPSAAGQDELAQLTHTFNEMLTRLEAQLTRERLFAHASAHELRTPITVIRAAASLSLEKERLPAEYQATLSQIAEVSDEMSVLTTRLMTLASAGQLRHTARVNLMDVVLLSTELHSLEASQKNVHLHVALPQQDVFVQGDQVSLVLVAGNLVQNAIQYTPAGGQIHVCCQEQEEWAVLSVQDSGAGIPEDDILRLIQPFQRGQIGNGAGLGLALGQAIAEAHGGTLQLRNVATGGLRAELRLPRYAAAPLHNRYISAQD